MTQRENPVRVVINIFLYMSIFYSSHLLFLMNLILSTLCLSSQSYAEVVYLKSGVRVIGEASKKTDTAVTLDYQGEPLVFYMVDVEKIRDEVDIPKVNIPFITREEPARFLDHTHIPLYLIIPTQEMNYKLSHFYLYPDDRFILDTLRFL